jgi:hypothetical protein
MKIKMQRVDHRIWTFLFGHLGCTYEKNHHTYNSYRINFSTYFLRSFQSSRDAHGGGVNKAEFIDADKETTKNKVLEGSNEFCQKEGKNAVIVSENTTFSGTFDEKTTNAIKKAGVIGGVLGSVDAANTSAAATEDAKYTTVLMFKCE